MVISFAILHAILPQLLRTSLKTIQCDESFLRKDYLLLLSLSFLYQCASYSLTQYLICGWLGKILLYDTDVTAANDSGNFRTVGFR